jgi:hypothetical protein
MCARMNGLRKVVWKQARPEGAWCGVGVTRRWRYCSAGREVLDGVRGVGDGVVEVCFCGWDAEMDRVVGREGKVDM